MSDQPKRRGRPPKDQNDLRSRHITVRFTEAMMAQVRAAAAASGLSLNREVERRLAASFGLASKASTQDAPGASTDLIRQIVREEIAAAMPKGRLGPILDRLASNPPRIWISPAVREIGVRQYGRDHLPS